jgi:hypothetical protein
LIWHQARTPDPVRSLRPDVPVGLEAVVARMMEKEPGRRFQTPLAAAEALKPWLTDTPLPPSGVELPPPAPALRRYTTETGRVTRSSASYPALRSAPEPSAEPMPSSANVTQSTVVDLTEAGVTWRGRVISDRTSGESSVSRPTPLPGDLNGMPVPAAGGLGRWGWALLGALLIGAAVFVVGVSAWQNNRPRESPHSAKAP